MIAGIVAAIFLGLLVSWITNHGALVLFGIVFPLTTLFYTRARWDGEHGVISRVKIRVLAPCYFFGLVSLIPTLLVFALENHPLEHLFGHGATVYTMLWHYLQDFSLFYGGFAIIGIVDEIIGFIFKQPISAPPITLNLFLGPLFLIAGIAASIWAVVKGFPGHVFSREFVASYLAVLHGCLPWAMSDEPRWLLCRRLIICGPGFVLMGIWMILAGIETPRKGIPRGRAGNRGRSSSNYPGDLEVVTLRPPWR